MISEPNIEPIFTKSFNLLHAQKAEISKQIEQMLAKDIIKECKSEWSSLILLIPKKANRTGERKWCIIVDYRKVKNCIHVDKFPLQNKI